MSAGEDHSAYPTTDLEGPKMRLVYIFAAIFAVSFAETSKEKYEDLVAMETMELKKESSDLTPQASVYSYVPPSQRLPQGNQNQNYIPQQIWTPPKVDNVRPSIPSIPSYVPPVTASPPSYVPPVQSDYIPPQNNYVPPQNNYVPPQNNYVPPQNNYVPPQNDYYPQWSTPNYHHPTTTPVSVIKNEQFFGDNGSYRYEYKIADGTWVGEEGYYTDPRGTEESLVKKGWYSYKGADGKTYTVTYWADHTGYHAFGDHLPTPSPAAQAAFDKAEAEKNQYTTTQKPYYPTYRPQQTYYPPQQTGYGKK